VADAQRRRFSDIGDRLEACPAARFHLGWSADENAQKKIALEMNQTYV
jgi:hypothetical protein